MEMVNVTEVIKNYKEIESRGKNPYKGGMRN